MMSCRDGIHLFVLVVVVVLFHSNHAFQPRHNQHHQHHQHVDRLQPSPLCASVEPGDVSGRTFDLAIIGAGPVGVSAALLAASKKSKSDRRIVLIDAPRGMSSLDLILYLVCTLRQVVVRCCAYLNITTCIILPTHHHHRSEWCINERGHGRGLELGRSHGSIQ